MRIRWDEACKVWCLTYSYSKYLHTIIYIFKQRSRSQKNIFQISTGSLASFDLLDLKTIFRRIDPKKNMSVEKIIVSAYLLRGREVKLPGFFIIQKVWLLGAMVEKQMYVNVTDGDLNLVSLGEAWNILIYITPLL